MKALAKLKILRKTVMKAKITNCIHESVIKNTYLKLLCLYPLIWYLFQPHFNKINVESHLYKEFTLGFLGRAITRRLDACATYAVACQEVANVNEVSFVNLYEAMLMQKVSSSSNKFDIFE